MRKRMRNIGKCETENCDEKAKTAGLCGACYQWHFHWKNQGVAAAQRYRRKVRRISARLRAMLPTKPALRKVNGTRRLREERTYLQ